MRACGLSACGRAPTMGPMEKLYDMFDRFVHSDWLATALGVAVILGITADRKSVV